MELAPSCKYFIIFSTLIIVQCFGDLIVLRHPTDNNGATRRLTCISENDDSALVWNYNGQAGGAKVEEHNGDKFQPKKSGLNTNTECAIRKSGECVANWEKSYWWHLVNSAKKPAGPVLDYRWEGFAELDFRDGVEREHLDLGDMGEYSGTVVFSARALRDLDIFLCHDKDETKSRCVWIRIGCSGGNQSRILTCAGGIPKSDDSRAKRDCTDIDNAWHETPVIDGYEWRTFRIEWKSEKKTIKLFKGTEVDPFLQGTMKQWNSVSHTFIRSEISSRVRFHFYDYYWTETKNTELSTTIFHPEKKNLCVELLVGLCPDCQLYVRLVDENGQYIAENNISGDKSSADNVPLFWKRITLDARSKSPMPELVRLKIGTIFDNNKAKGQWAVDSFRICESQGGLRESTITTHQEKVSPFVWPQFNCQKLSYSKSAVVNSLSTNTIDHDTSQLLKLIRNSVTSDSNRSLGEKWSICNPTGCACDRGYTGNDCQTECESGFYGYNCKKKCGSCSRGSCDRVNGHCPSGCQTAALLPPFCKKVGQPIVEDITDTTARILEEVTPELLEYVTNFRFIITGGAGIGSVITTTSSRGSTYTVDITGLQPGSTYHGYANVTTNFNGIVTEASSMEIIFVTTLERCFEVEPQSSHIVLTSRPDLEGCGVGTGSALPGGSYYVEFREKSTETLSTFVIPHFPHTFENLQPYTEYKLTVYVAGGTVILWTKTVRTLQSAPGKVHRLRYSHISDTNVTLQWMAPLRKNGIIVNYSVSIKRITLLACQELGKETPPQDDITAKVNGTIASFSGLNPYAKYTASVIAHTTEPGMEEWIDFQTLESDKPTSSVRNLELINNQTRLRWDKPKNCLKITGSTRLTRLVFTKLRDSEQNWTAVYNTMDDHFDLYELNLAHYTSYNVRVYVLSHMTGRINYALYQEKNWTTAPSAPSAVKDLELYDADFDANVISLRWKPPKPANGEIEFYHVSINGKENRTITALKKTPICELWENYVCLENITIPLNVRSSIAITVYAKNKDVKKVGNSTQRIFKPLANEAPNAPEFNETQLGHGVVMLRWKYPFSPVKITEFHITVKFVATDLWKKKNEKIPFTIDHESTPRCKEYSQLLFLATSTEYNISMTSKCRNKSQSDATYKVISVPHGFGFVGGKRLRLVKTGSIINVTVPIIINATRNTMVHVIVNGTANCTSKTSSPVISKTELTVARYNTNRTTRRRWTIDTNRVQPKNCSLVVGETYEIKIVVKSTNGSDLMIVAHDSISLSDDDLNPLWFTALLLIPLLALFLYALLIWRRNFKRASRARRNGHVYPKPANSTLNLIAVFTSKRSKSSPCAIGNRDSGPIYAVPFESDSRLVRAEYFPEYTKNASSSGLLLSQYMMFPRDLTKPCEYGKLPQNMPKNRDKNQIPYDDSRVVLQKIPGDPDSDYINASYIQGHRGDKAYIATQGPLPNTINDFWRMIWQEKVYVICMLTNLVEDGKTKCEQYWPEVGIKVKYGDVSVLVTDLKVFADYTIRNYRLGCQKYKRKITHLHYTAWPDRGIPTYSQSLVIFLKQLMDTPTGNGPIVVHCSTGDGRTGTLILCDICLRQAVEEKVIDVVAVTTQMRENRADMVDGPQQYILAHVVITESLMGMITQVACDDDFSTKIKRLRKQLPSDMERLDETVWQEQVLYSVVESKYPTPGDFARNKIPELDSVCPDVIYFVRYSAPNTEKDDYIGVVSVDGVRAKKQYLASGLPSKSTWSKFWLVIAKQNVQLIITLQAADPNDPTCCDIMPDKPIFAPVPHILVERKQSIQEEKHFALEEFLLTDTSGEERKPRLVTVLKCTGWERGRYGKPPSPATLVSLWQASGKILRKEGLSLVFCHDGVTGCGLYLALSFLLERMAVEKECDVISAVRAVRRFRPEFVRDLEAFEYLYDAAENYVECFQTYANFT